MFFRGLIDATECPEELAAVFAHEIGHVEARDPTRIALRSAGSIDVLGLLFGRAQWRTGAVGGERIIKGDDTKDAEADAVASASCWTQTCRHLPLPHCFRDWRCKAVKMRALWST